MSDEGEKGRRSRVQVLPPLACPYASGPHRSKGEWLAVRQWFVRSQHEASGLNVRVAAILISGSVGDYAVYMGVGELAWVARHGNKLSFDDAASLFPGIAITRYRP